MARDIYDGSSEGTQLVKDITPGSDGSYASSLTAVGDFLYMNAFDPSHGFELWKSDGTSNGTSLVMDIYPGLGGGSPAPINQYPLMTVRGNQIVFAGYTQANGYEPWVSDGTLAGTRNILDILNGPDSSLVVN